jgi:hypothetical protein
MEATRAQSYRRRNGCIILNRAPGDSLPVLHYLLKEAGVEGYSARAEYLDSSRAVLCRAFHRTEPGPVSIELVHAVRRRFPHVPFEVVFKEVGPDAAVAGSHERRAA